MKRFLFGTLLFVVVFKSPSFGQDWRLAGNSDASGTSKLGTTNSQPLRLFTNNVERFRISSSGQIGIGITNPVNLFALKVRNASNPVSSWHHSSMLFAGFSDSLAEMMLGVASGGVGNSPFIVGRRSRGTLAAPLIVNPDDVLLRMAGSGYSGNRFMYSSEISFVVDGPVTTTSLPSAIVFRTGTTSSVMRERMNIGSSGDIRFHNDQLYVPVNGGIGLGTTTPHASAILELKSTSKGVLFPRLTSNQRLAIQDPAVGLIVYQTDGDSGLYVSHGRRIWSSTTPGANLSLSNVIDPVLNQSLAFAQGTFPMFYAFPPQSSGTATRMIFSESSGAASTGLRYTARLGDFDFLKSANTPLLHIGGDGKIGIGTTLPRKSLHVVGDAFVRLNLSISPSNTDDPRSSKLYIRSHVTDLYGMYVTAGSPIGIQSVSYGAPSRLFTAILGAATTIGNHRAGYFDGNVVATGTFTQASDKKFKDNIRNIEEPLKKLMQIGVHTYRYNNQFSEINLPQGNQYGVIAQDLENILPDLVVNTIHNSTASQPLEFKAVNYIGLIPILIGALQEEENKVEELKKQVEKIPALEDRIAQLESLINDRLNRIDNGTQAWIKQNVPNPVRTGTTIQYFIPAEVRAARILFTNAKGQQLKYYNVSGAGSIEFNAGTLPSGSYNYSLITDGKTVATKQMIIAR